MSATGEVHGQIPGAGVLERDLLQEAKKNDKMAFLTEKITCAKGLWLKEPVEYGGLMETMWPDQRPVTGEIR